MSSSLKWRIAIGLVLVFLAGLSTGVFAAAWHARHTFAGRHGAHMAERMRERLKTELNLTPTQLDEMKPLLENTAKRLQQIRVESGQRVSETLAESHQQLATFLTPAQQAQLAVMKKHHRHLLRLHPAPHSRLPADPP